MYQHLLTMNLYICLRRLYENKSGTFNFQKFIENCKSNIDEFSGESLRERKIKDGLSEDKADKYIENAYQPTVADFNKLSRDVRLAKMKEMKSAASRIASRVFAHAVDDEKTMKSLTNFVKFDDVEEALLSIWNCHRQVRQMYDNGRKPDFRADEYPYKKEIYDSVSKQV